MSFLDLIKQVYVSLRANRMRSALTMFGIVWGIASVIILVGIGDGFKEANKREFSQLGSNISIIWGGRTSLQPGGQRGGKDIRFKEEDVLAILQQASLVKHASPEIRRDLQIEYGPKTMSTDVHGVYPAFGQMRSLIIESGRFINPQDFAEKRSFCVIGDEVNRRLFSGEDPVGKTLRIQNRTFLVIGKLQKKDMGSRYGNADDEQIFIPFSTAQQMFSRKYINNIVISPRNPEEDEAALAEVKRILGRRLDFNPEDRDAINIWNTARSARQVNTLFFAIELLMTLIGGVTLGVGGVGVMNIMLVSVTERTREIGIRRALGATRKNILFQFLSEALLLTFFSGLIGMGVGVGLTELIASLPLPDGFDPPVVSTTVVITSIILLTFVGVFAGTYPALKASRLSPMEALRYE